MHIANYRSAYSRSASSIITSHLAPYHLMIPLFAITIMALFTVGSLGHDVSNEMPGSLTDYPASFSVPVNCSITKQVEKVPYCLTGVLDPLRKWIVFDLYMFDVDHPEKTVLFGVILTLHNGSVEGMIPRAGGCAAPVYVQLKPPQIRAATTICTSTNIISAATFGNTTYFNGSTATHVADAFKVPVESSVISGKGILRASVWTTGKDFSSRPSASGSFRMTVYSEMTPLDNSTLNWQVFSALVIGIPKYPRETMFNVHTQVHIKPKDFRGRSE